MKSTLFKINVFIASFALLFSCGSDSDNDGEESTPLSSQKEILTFEVANTSGEIDNLNDTVTAQVLENSLTSLTPVIEVSPGATISPTSGSTQDFTNPVIYTITAEDGSTIEYSVSVRSAIYQFTANETNYELIRQEMFWLEAVDIAVMRGGFLAEVNNVQENSAIVEALLSDEAQSDSEFITVFLGGNNIADNNIWVFDGNNDGEGFQFWEGEADGNPIPDVYSNWATNRPALPSISDASGLRITLNEGPFNLIGQWETLEFTPNSRLFFLIEFN